MQMNSNDMATFCPRSFLNDQVIGL